MIISASAGTLMSLVRLLTIGTGSPRKVPTKVISSMLGTRICEAMRSSGWAPMAKLIGCFSARAARPL